MSQRLRHCRRNTAIVRLSKVLHRSNPLFSSWLSELSQEKITPFEDLNFSPSDEFAAAVFYKILSERKSGVFPRFCKEDISYCDAATYLAKKYGFDESKVIGGSRCMGLVGHAPNFPHWDALH